MGPPTGRPASSQLAASVLLGAVAGFVDAVCFGSVFGVFPANQSGNAIYLGVALGDGTATQVWPPATAMVGFVLGVAVAVAVRRSARVPATTRALVALEVVLLAGVALAVGSLTDIAHPLTDLRGAVLLLVASVAMGVQTEVIRDHAGVAISTTYQTGALTHIAEDLAGGTSRRAEEHRRPAGPVVVLTAVLVGYVVGAALGARLDGVWGAALAVPVAALVVLLVTVTWWDRAPAHR